MRRALWVLLLTACPSKGTPDAATAATPYKVPTVKCQVVVPAGWVESSSPMPDHVLELLATAPKLRGHLVVREAAAAMDDVPYLTCNDVPPRIEALVGLKLGGGWRAAVRARLEKRATCTHLMELIGPAITTLFQSMSYRDIENMGGETKNSRAQKPYFVDGCWSWRADGPTLKKYFPQFAEKAE